MLLTAEQKTETLTCAEPSQGALEEKAPPPSPVTVGAVEEARRWGPEHKNLNPTTVNKKKEQKKKDPKLFFYWK